MAKGDWKTAITTHVDGKPHVAGYDLIELAGRYSFTDAIYLVLRGDLPDESSSEMLDAILTIAIDHGIETPSAVAARTVYSGGSPVNSAVAAGVLALGEWHGGAIEACMEMLQQTLENGEETSVLVGRYKAKSQRLPGFGHRVYEVDPRTVRLLEVASELGFVGKYVKAAQEIEKSLNNTSSKALPLNIDGIVAALLLEMGFAPKVGKGIFIIARTPGLVAQVVEEATREKPFRRLSEEEVQYDGPRPRKLPSKDDR